MKKDSYMEKYWAKKETDRKWDEFASGFLVGLMPAVLLFIVFAMWGGSKNPITLRGFMGFCAPYLILGCWFLISKN